MPSREFLALVDALRQANESRSRTRALRAVNAAVTFTVDDLAYRVGEHVIDLVSGQKGVVLAGERHTVIVQTAERAAG